MCLSLVEQTMKLLSLSKVSLPDNFYRDLLVGFVIQSSDNLSKASFTDNFQYFVAKPNVIV